MNRCQQTRTRLLLILLLTLVAGQGCGNALTIASRTISTTSAAIESAAKAGEAYHRGEVEKLTAQLLAARAELGCGSGESLPAGCKLGRWADIRELYKGKMDRATKRYEKFTAAVLTADAAVALAADAALAAEANKEGPSLGDIVQRLYRAYRAVAIILRAWGIDAPGGV